MHKFKIVKHAKNDLRKSCLLVDLKNQDKPIYIYCCHLPASDKFFFSKQETKSDKNSDWLKNPEQIIDFEILDFIKKYLTES